MLVLYFDLDGTILDSSQCSVVSAQDTFRKFCAMDLPAALVIEKMGIPIEITFRELSNGKIHDGNWEDVAAYFRDVYKENTDRYTSLYKGVPEFLKRARQCADSIIIVTSKKSAAAEHNLQKLDILSYFDHIVGSDKVDHYKPHPDPVYKARALLSGAPLMEWVIGDADTDIMMGAAAGVKTCAVTWGAHDRERLARANPDFMADDFTALEKILLPASR